MLPTLTFVSAGIAFRGTVHVSVLPLTTGSAIGVRRAADAPLQLSRSADCGLVPSLSLFE